MTNSNSYSDIVDMFKRIETVEVDSKPDFTKEKPYTIITQGVGVTGFKTCFFSDYKHLEVANEVAKRVQYFVGIE